MREVTRSDLAGLLPGVEHLAAALGTRLDVRDVLHRLVDIQVRLQGPADFLTMPRLLEELGVCMEVLLLVENEVYLPAAKQRNGIGPRAISI
jgi:hypothetical protein